MCVREKLQVNQRDKKKQGRKSGIRRKLRKGKEEGDKYRSFKIPGKSCECHAVLKVGWIVAVTV